LYEDLPDLFRQRSSISTCNNGLKLRKQDLGDGEGSQPRQKLMHTKGVVASVVFESKAEHDYTGLF